ncbi:MAG: GNAT family N-acetyltransferase [Candidatus Heimdallarchaeota archaeon]
MPTLSVEEFTLEDAPAIAQLLQRVWSSVTEYPPTWRERRMLSAEEIHQEMQEGDFRYFGIRTEGHIVGVYKLSIGKEILGEHQAVDPAYRRKGLARLMYEQFLELGRQLGKPNCINLLVTNKKMIAFVTRLGFRPSGDPYEQDPGMFVQKFYFYHETV